MTADSCCSRYSHRNDHSGYHTRDSSLPRSLSNDLVLLEHGYVVTCGPKSWRMKAHANLRREGQSQ